MNKSKKIFSWISTVVLMATISLATSISASAQIPPQGIKANHADHGEGSLRELIETCPNEAVIEVGNGARRSSRGEPEMQDTPPCQ